MSLPFKIISTLDCPSPGFKDSWKYIPTEESRHHLYVCLHETRYDLSRFGANMSTEVLAQFIAMIAIEMQTGYDFNNSLWNTIRSMMRSLTMRNILLQLDAKMWANIAKIGGIKHHRCAPLVHSLVGNKYHDVYGIVDMGSYIEISLHCRGTALTGRRYLPLTGDPIIMNYSGHKWHCDDALEYAKISLKLQGKTPLITHPSMVDIPTDDIREIVIDSIKKSISILSHPLIEALRKSHLTAGIVKLSTENPNEFEYILSCLKIRSFTTSLGKFLQIPITRDYLVDYIASLVRDTPGTTIMSVFMPGNGITSTINQIFTKMRAMREKHNSVIIMRNLHQSKDFHGIMIDVRRRLSQ